ncbi:MAG: hypothetical protein ABIM83_08140 [candidate division WOR-3 bacterium]
MRSKILITNKEIKEDLSQVACIITFNLEYLNSKVYRQFPTIFIDLKEKYKRKYFNFRTAQKEFSEHLLRDFLIFQRVIDYIFPVAYFCLNYYYHKIYNQGFKENLKPNYLLREISKIIEANYHYYSISCALLTPIFFFKIGLPSSLPKIFEYIYGFDFLDDFFFPLAAVFTVFEYTNDLLLGEKNFDPICICRSFLSFLLWRKSRALLNKPLEKLILAGASKKDIWITL